MLVSISLAFYIQCAIYRPGQDFFEPLDFRFQGWLIDISRWPFAEAPSRKRPLPACTTTATIRHCIFTFHDSVSKIFIRHHGLIAAKKVTPRFSAIIANISTTVMAGHFEIRLCMFSFHYQILWQSYTALLRLSLRALDFARRAFFAYDFRRKAFGIQFPVRKILIFFIKILFSMYSRWRLDTFGPVYWVSSQRGAHFCILASRALLFRCLSVPSPPIPAILIRFLQHCRRVISHFRLIGAKWLRHYYWSQYFGFALHTLID